MKSQATQAGPTHSFVKERLKVNTYGTPEEMGGAAAELVEEHLRAAIAERGRANLILATGMSQMPFLEALKEKDIDWSSITVFHLDEYMDLPEDHPASFRRYLKERILDTVKPGVVHLINGNAGDVEAEMTRYESLLHEHPIDVACIGIGENGHIAFNDPPVADFDDPKWVKEVDLDEGCRQQQVNEGWFPSIDQTPRRAVTLTIPAIMSSRVISCVVPGERKAEAVRNTLNGPVSTDCPATILRSHSNATLFLDQASAADL